MNAKTSDRISYGHRLDWGVHPVSQLELHPGVEHVVSDVLKVAGGLAGLALVDLQDWRIIFSWSVNRCENSRCSSNAPGTPHVSACDAAAARVSSFRAARTSWSLVLIAAAIAVFFFSG